MKLWGSQVCGGKKGRDVLEPIQFRTNFHSLSHIVPAQEMCHPYFGCKGSSIQVWSSKIRAVASKNFLPEIQNIQLLPPQPQLLTHNRILSNPYLKQVKLFPQRCSEPVPITKELSRERKSCFSITGHSQMRQFADFSRDLWFPAAAQGFSRVALLLHSVCLEGSREGWGVLLNLDPAFLCGGSECADCHPGGTNKDLKALFVWGTKLILHLFKYLSRSFLLFLKHNSIMKYNKFREQCLG